MVVYPPPLREPVLLLRIQLRQPPGAGALRALSDARRIVRAAVSCAPGGGWVAVSGGSAEGFRCGHPVGEFLAVGVCDDQRDGAGAGGDGMTRVLPPSSPDGLALREAKQVALRAARAPALR